MTSEDLRQCIASLRGHATWMRNYAKDPIKYFDPAPTTPDALDQIADMLADLRRDFSS